jgi:hypothetical protein
MLIKTLEEMERIVNKNDSLIWDGWTVVSIQPARNGVMSKDGLKVGGKWYLQKRFDATANGWDIPDKLVG